jgi:biotin carboxyl carrier protein
MEALLTHGEGLLVPERMIISPTVGVFRPLDDVWEGQEVDEGQPIGQLEGPGTSTPVCSPFRGRLVGMLVHTGERLREGQAVAWLRVS